MVLLESVRLFPRLFFVGFLRFAILITSSSLLLFSVSSPVVVVVLLWEHEHMNWCDVG